MNGTHIHTDTMQKGNFINFGRQKRQHIQSVLSPYQHSNTGQGLSGVMDRKTNKHTQDPRLREGISKEWFILGVDIPLSSITSYNEHVCVGTRTKI